MQEFIRRNLLEGCLFQIKNTQDHSPAGIRFHPSLALPKFKGTTLELHCSPPPLLSYALMNGPLRVDFNYRSVEVGIGHALNWNETHFSPQQGREENGG